MTAPICLVFPHQLFEQHPAFAEVQTFWLIEDDLFFMRLPFHRKKLAYHRASMSYYAEKLRSKGFEVRYIKHKDAQLANMPMEAWWPPNPIFQVPITSKSKALK